VQRCTLRFLPRGSLRMGCSDRLLWAWLSRYWSGWRSALAIVKPETVIAWHRQGFRLYWKWKSGQPLHILIMHLRYFAQHRLEAGII